MTRTAADSPPKPRGAATRQRIVTAATELFSARGYHGTGVAELLEVAQVSRGSFYHHFDDKEAVLYEISLVPVENMCIVSSRIAADGTPATERIRRLAAVLVEDIGVHQAQWRVFLRDFEYLSEDRRAAVLAARDRFESYWEQVLDAGYRSGEFREISKLRVKGILGMFNFSVLWMDPVGPVSPREIAEDFVELILAGICVDASE
ncbi:TetR family transcriptional regulator [Antricoccus suffuscus]|uniref:TetR family transcriptional regulator n=1 Tax=Antricoccus suffuscus TaxID=1629062 RepID=A0A2T1A3Z4_9ACTN|nr:TetR/AcrR family transcriptional regulator [Antricoccus suffuscus]PRZ43028.1 TetR family transcriptional regulator [Antricoccus suffuscus]